MYSHFLDSIKVNFIEKLNSDFNLTEEEKEEIFSEAQSSLKNDLEDQAIKNPKDFLELVNKESDINSKNYIVQNLTLKFSENLKSKNRSSIKNNNKISGFVVIFILTEISNQLSSNEKTAGIKEILNFLGLGSELKEIAKISLEKPSGRISDYSHKIF